MIMKLFIITLSLFVYLGWVLPSAAGAAKNTDPGFTAADLLQWKEQGRESFYHTAVGMMGAVVAQAQSGYGVIKPGAPFSINCMRSNSNV